MTEKIKNSIFPFLIVAIVLNLLQSAFTQLSGDEALYWMYSRNMDWGFKDHPPVIGLLTGAGYFLFKNELGVRLMIVVCHAITLWSIYRLCKPIAIWKFALIALSIPILQVYSFIATPDVPLLMFTALYLLVWRKFLDKQNLQNTLLLGMVMAALVWSKYHGILVIVLTLLPQKKLWFNKHYWLAALFGIALYSPHIMWQALNDLPTMKFHLVDRAGEFEWKHLFNYLGGQLMVFNPVVLGLALFAIFKSKSTEQFSKSLHWLIVGLLALFLFSSFRGRIEPHWTAAALVPVIIVLGEYFSHNPFKNWHRISLGFFAAVILLVRIGLLVDFIPQLKKQFNTDNQKMGELKELAQGHPVCFMNSYQNPSLYMFYTGEIAHNINDTGGGGAKNQYDLWSYNHAIHHQRFLYVASYPATAFDYVRLECGVDCYYRFEDDLQVMNHLYIRTDEWLHNLHSGDEVSLPATISNSNNYEINFADTVHALHWK